jgi:hypothetical protein
VGEREREKEGEKREMQSRNRRIERVELVLFFEKVEPLIRLTHDIDIDIDIDDIYLR